MQDLSSTIIAKSDQLNAVDLMAGDKIIKITKITQSASAEQPISIEYEGGEGRPYKPSLTMRRLLISCMGKDGDKYIGNSLQLYRNPEITWGKEQCGGIEFSHCTGIDGDISVVLQTGRNKRKRFTVKVLNVEPETIDPAIEEWKLKFSIAETKIDIDKLINELKETELKPESKKAIGVFYKESLERVKEQE